MSIRLTPEQTARAKAKADTLNISFNQYICNLVESDTTTNKADDTTEIIELAKSILRENDAEWRKVCTEISDSYEQGIKDMVSHFKQRGTTDDTIGLSEAEKVVPSADLDETTTSKTVVPLPVLSGTIGDFDGGTTVFSEAEKEAMAQYPEQYERGW